MIEIIIGVGIGYFFHKPIGRGLGVVMKKIRDWRNRQDANRYNE